MRVCTMGWRMARTNDLRKAKRDRGTFSQDDERDFFRTGSQAPRFIRKRNGQKISRLLIVNSAGACVGILHRSIFTEMLAGGLQDSPPVDVTTATISSLLTKQCRAYTGMTYDDFHPENDCLCRPGPDPGRCEGRDGTGFRLSGRDRY